MSFVYEPQAQVDNTTAAGGHAMMKDIARLLTQVGMSRVQTTPAYDPDGPVSQAPTTYNTYGSPMVFAMTGARQAAEPIFVVFKLGYGSMGASNNAAASNRWYVHATVCTSVSSAGVPGGAQIAMAEMGGYSSTAYYAFSPGAWGGGHFASYDEEGLTLILGRRALRTQNSSAASATSVAFRSAVWLHIERRADAGGASVTDFAVMLDQLPLAANGLQVHPYFGLNAFLPRQYRVSDAHWCNTLLRSVQGQNVTESVSAFERAGGVNGLFDGVGALVSPVYCPGDGGLLPLRKLFTIPKAAIPAEGGRVTLDFSGVEKDYLAAPSDWAHINMRDDLAFLYEMS